MEKIKHPVDRGILRETAGNGFATSCWKVLMSVSVVTVRVVGGKNPTYPKCSLRQALTSGALVRSRTYIKWRKVQLYLGLASSTRRPPASWHIALKALSQERSVIIIPTAP
jgi:hypothetical protein